VTDGPGLEAEIERLYGLPLDQFVASRDELARGLRKAGDRAAADGIKALRRPTVAAWALNQVQRGDRKTVGRLIAAGDRLREAQEQLLASGEPGSLRDAAADERRLIEQLARAAEARLVEGGHPSTAATDTKVRATLRAVASDAEARELLQSGRLVRDYELSDLGLGGLAAGAAAAPRSPARKEKAPPEPAPKRAPEAPRPSKAAERAARVARERAERGRAQQLELDHHVQAAGERLTAARRAAAEAAKALDRAQADADKAQARAQAAAARLEELEAALRTAEAELAP
jgi:hypothetical protein